MAQLAGRRTTEPARTVMGLGVGRETPRGARLGSHVVGISEGELHL